MFKFILYATSQGIYIREIRHIRHLLDSYNTDIVIINNMSDLICIIPGLCKENTAAILFASSDIELEDLVKVKEHFGDIPTVLVLPDERTETFQAGMLLKPLFFMSRQDAAMHLSMAINELCYIYKEHFRQSSQYYYLQ